MTNYDTLQTRMLDGTAGQAVPHWVRQLLDDVAQGRATVPMTRHPLGFSCIPVERTGQRGVCVHIWSDSLPRAGPTTSTVHAHSWDLVSYVLYGTVRNEVIDVSDAPDRPTHRLFEIRSGTGGIDEVRDTSRLVRYETTTTGTHHQGEVYSLPAGVFHRTTVGRDTATVALGSGLPGIVDLALGRIDTTSHTVRRRRCGRDEITHAARVVLGRLPVPEPRHPEEPWTHRRR